MQCLLIFDFVFKIRMSLCLSDKQQWIVGSTVLSPTASSFLSPFAVLLIRLLASYDVTVLHASTAAVLNFRPL